MLRWFSVWLGVLCAVFKSETEEWVWTFSPVVPPELIRNWPMHAMQTLTTWRWSSWVSCAPEASPILGKVKVETDRWQWSMNYKSKCVCLLKNNNTNHDDRSYFLLVTVFQEFVRCTNKDIEQIIKKEMSGDVKNAFYAIGNNCLWHYNILLLSVSQCALLTAALLWLLLSPFLLSLYFAVRSVKNQPSYFADRLYKAMKVFILSALNKFVLYNSSCSSAARHRSVVLAD